jgi:hypothetical protein
VALLLTLAVTWQPTVIDTGAEAQLRYVCPAGGEVYVINLQKPTVLAPSVNEVWCCNHAAGASVTVAWLLDGLL